MKIMMKAVNIMTRRKLLVVAFVLATNLAAVSSVGAQDSPCGSRVQTQRVTYLPISGRLYANAFDPRTDPSDPNYEVRLRGSLHYRRVDGETLKNRPVLIFNHGHEQSRGEVCELVKYFTNHDWVVFMPLRRGHFLDQNDDGDGTDADDIRSTGVYVDDFVTACARSFSQADSSSYLPYLYCGSGFCRPDLPCGVASRSNAVELAYLNEQRIDVRDQIAYIKSLPAIATEILGKTAKLADPKRIVILGHSYGGALTVLTNAHDYGQSVAIDISGAELSWDNADEPYWGWDLQAAMLDQKRPIYFLQPKNGRFLTPTKTLFGIAVDQGFRSQAAIFPPAACFARNDDGTETFPPCNNEVQTEFKQIHGTFISHAEQIARWGPSVIEFMKRYPR